MLSKVAPLAGSVDRNRDTTTGETYRVTVAPLAGSVDRNGYQEAWADYRYQSLPSRGAWIEIGPWFAFLQRLQGRSPRGERG